MIARILVAVALALGGSLAAQQRVPLDGEWRIDDRAVTVPAAFETALGTDFDGVATYRRTLPLPSRRGGRVRVEFDAVATHALVRCNGTVCGEHLGGWTPFRVDVTAALKWDGDDVLEVVVDERVGHNTQGFLPIIQPHFGGIWQGVTLCLDDGPVIDRQRLFLFGSFRTMTWGIAPCLLSYEVPVLDGAADVEVHVEVGTDREPVVRSGPNGELEVPNAEPWAPDSPRLYPVRIALRRSGVELDHVERRVGFRCLEADGTRVRWNGTALQLRGILHWGYSPPHLAPPTDPDYWRAQLRDFRALGFNCVKCCLWVPPRCFYELCDELGLLVWQEYPTWHPQMDQAHKQELLTEYGEFFVHDRSHCSVAFRSITCETGHGADFDVVKSLYEACKAAVPDTLVVDDSSWIGWQRITDFWDEHPYGNNSWFPGRLEEFERHIAEKGEKPLLLGECLTGDTWVDRGAWTAAFGDDPAHAWHRPICWDDQVATEAWLADRFGAETLASLLPVSKDFAMRNRKFQIEQLRLSIPDAGYVVSVARDIAKCRMGLYDHQGVMKWTPADWAWHRDTMLCLDLPWNGRSQPAHALRAPVRVSHYGRGRLLGRLRVWCDEPAAAVEQEIDLAPGELSAPLELRLTTDRPDLAPLVVHAELSGSHPATNEWRLWGEPDAPRAETAEVIVADALTAELLADLEAGKRVLLRAGDRKGSIRTEGMWFLRGAPFAPPHPLRAELGAALLELASFDLESGRVMPWDGLRDEVDPILAFWETHDIAEVRLHLYAFETRVGNGRLLCTTFDLAGSDHVRDRLLDHLRRGPSPQHALAAGTIGALKRKLSEKKLDLPVWRFRTDADDRGLGGGWFRPTTDVATAAWRDLRAGSHWENQGDDLKQYTGVAWYRVDVDVPADWQGLESRLVCEGVDDSFECWVNGTSVGRFGDPATNTTIWLERQVVDVAATLRPGATNTIVLRVVDHMGAGGLWKPVFLTTGPTDDRSRLLH